MSALKPSRGPRLAIEALEDRLTPVTSILSTDASLQTPLPGDATVLQTNVSGRYVLFQSQALNVIAGQRNTFPGEFNLFWQDVQTGDRRLVSSDRFSGGLTASGFERYTPGQALTGVISDDGQSVAYVTKRNAAVVSDFPPAAVGKLPTLDNGDNSPDVFLWNAGFQKSAAATNQDFNVLMSFENKQSTIISRVAQIAAGNTTGATNPAISADGKVVSFVSTRNANAIDPTRVITANAVQVDDFGDTTPDLFRVEITTLIAPQDGGGKFVVEIDDARLVTAYSNAGVSKNVIAFGNTASRLEVDPLGRYMSADASGFAFISNLSPNSLAETSSGSPGSAPGTTEVYHSTFENQVNLGPRGLIDSRINLITTVAGALGQRPGPGAVATPQTSPNGRALTAIIPADAPNRVIFAATIPSSAQLVPGYVSQNGGAAEVYVREIEEFTVTPAELVSAQFRTQVVGANAPAGADPASITSDRLGVRIAFASAATNLTRLSPTAYTPGAANVFVRDTTLDTTSLASASFNGQSGGNGTSANPRLNNDGSVVAFESQATNLALVVDSNGGPDVFVRNLTNNSIGVASAAPDNRTTGNGISNFPVIGGVATNGALFFNTTATNLDPLYTNVPTGSRQVVFVTTPFQTQSTSRGVAISGGTSGLAGIVTIGSDGNLDFQQAPVTPFPGFVGPISVSAGDVNGDGVSDLVAGGGPGGGPRIRVIDGISQKTRFDFFAYESTFRGGVNVALADVNGDGFDDIIVGSGVGGGPRVRVFSGKDASVLADFFAFESTFRGGVRVAGGDIDGDGRADIVVAAGEGGGPRVVVFSGADLSGGTRLADFFAFEPGLRNGVYVGVGDVTGDGRTDLAVGGGPGGGPRVSVFDSATVLAPPLAGTLPTLFNFFAFPDSTANRTGVRVAIRNVTGGSADSIVAAAGAGSPVVRVFDPAAIGGATNPAPLTETFAFGQAIGLFGAFVG